MQSYSWLILALLGLASCSKPSEEENTRSSTAPVTADQSTAPPPAATPTHSTPLPKTGVPTKPKTKEFYEMKVTRPPEVCGEAGFAYLWEGYLVPECGTCHYNANQFKVTAFAERRDLTSSYEVMRYTVNGEALLKAVVENSLCVSCTIKHEDPLYKDIQYFLAHRSSCEGS